MSAFKSNIKKLWAQKPIRIFIILGVLVGGGLPVIQAIPIAATIEQMTQEDTENAEQ